MAEEDPIIDGRPLSSLKVTELREELESRGLNTKGVKAVLQERLREHLNNPPVVEENPIVAEYRAKQKIALAAQIAADPRKKQLKEEGAFDKDPTPEVVQEKSTDDSESPAAPEKSSESSQDDKKEESAEIEIKPAETAEAASDSSSSGSSSRSSSSSATPANSEEVSKERESAAEKATVEENHQVEKPEEKITEQEPVVPETEEPETEPTPEKEEEESPKETTTNSADLEAEKDDDADELDYGEEEEKDGREENGESMEEQDDERKDDTDAEKKEKVHRVVAERRRASSPSSRHPVSEILHIRGLTRPFTERMLREKISSHGGEIVDFWMDKIKSHCFVKMTSKENATTVRNAMNNTKWPESNPKMLAIVFDEEERMTNYKEGKGEVELPKVVTIGTLTGGSRTERLTSSSSTTSAGKANLKITLENTVRENSKREIELKEKRSSLAGRLTRIGDKEKKVDGDHREDRKRQRSETPPHSRVRLTEEKRGRAERRDPTPEKIVTPDDLFKKTKSLPAIYYLPLTDEQVAAKLSKKTESHQRTRDRSRERDRPRRH